MSLTTKSHALFFLTSRAQVIPRIISPLTARYVANSTSAKPSSSQPFTRRGFLWDYYLTQIHTSRLLLLLQHNNLTVPEHMTLSRDLTRAGLRLTIVKSSIFGAAISTTIYSNLSPLVLGPIAIITADDPDPQKVAGMLAVINRNKKMLLLGGKLDDALLSVEDIARVSSLPGLERSREELVGVIGEPARKITEILERPGWALGMALGQHERQLRGESA